MSEHPLSCECFSCPGWKWGGAAPWKVRTGILIASCCNSWIGQSRIPTLLSLICWSIGFLAPNSASTCRVPWQLSADTPWWTAVPGHIAVGSSENGFLERKGEALFLNMLQSDIPVEVQSWVFSKGSNHFVLPYLYEFKCSHTILIDMCFLYSNHVGQKSFFMSHHKIDLAWRVKLYHVTRICFLFQSCCFFPKWNFRPLSIQ